MGLAYEGIKLISNSLKRKIKGQTKFQGNAEEICTKITKQCWNGKYLINSLGNYKEFWARDFGLSVDALLAMGFKKEARETIKYALKQYKKQGKITTTIHNNGKLFNFPPGLYSPDSTAYVLYSLKKINAKELTKQYKDFLQKETNKFFEKTLDKKTGMIKKKKYSSMRDFVATRASCYDCTIMFWMSELARSTGLKAPKLDKKKLIETYWNGEYFRNGVEEEHFTTEANIIPFWTGLVKDPEKFRKVIQKIEKERLNKPLALKYTKKLDEKHIFFEFLAPAWERDKVWTNIGLMYLLLLAKYDKNRCKKEIKKYEKLIEKQKTIYECYEELKPYRSLLYLSDEGMMWGINLPYIKRSCVQ
ncbi:hypothetical protein DRJ25_00325 [Candidatus Woesearchaeota archaeon]|nr:MAG: hypothetical protein DRJ25_00325 [Candidatus Woesearchaeota archaeon]